MVERGSKSAERFVVLLVVGVNVSSDVTRDLDSTRQVFEIVRVSPLVGAGGSGFHCFIKVSSHCSFPFDTSIIPETAVNATHRGDIFPILGDIFTLFSLRYRTFSGIISFFAFSAIFLLTFHLFDQSREEDLEILRLLLTLEAIPPSV